MSRHALAATVPPAEARADALDRAWVGRALCQGRSRWFFDPPRESERARARREAVAARFCAACPVQEACRDYARHNHEHGFWGGETEEQRARAGYAPRSSGRRSVLAAIRAARTA